MTDLFADCYEPSALAEYDGFSDQPTSSQAPRAGRPGRSLTSFPQVNPAFARACVVRERPVVAPAPPPVPTAADEPSPPLPPFHAEVRNNTELRHAIRRRVEELNISRLCLDRVAGFHSGYSASLLAENDRKRIGQLTLDLLLGATGLKMVLVEDPEALAKVAPQYEPRARCNVRLNNSIRRSAADRKRIAQATDEPTAV